MEMLSTHILLTGGKTTCDYNTFDKKNSSTRDIRRYLYQHFLSKGYTVQSEVKLLPHHYTHFVFSNDESQNIALELVSDNVTAKAIQELDNQYAEHEIAVQRIVISNVQHIETEEKTNFIKRYLLNSSPNKDLLIISPTDGYVYQFIEDRHLYIYKEQHLESKNYPRIYEEKSTIQTLIFNDGGVAIEGFHERYGDWLAQKRRAFENKVLKLEEQENFLNNQFFNTYWQSVLNRTYVKPDIGKNINHKFYGLGLIYDYNEESGMVGVRWENGDFHHMNWNTLLANKLLLI